MRSIGRGKGTAKREIVFVDRSFDWALEVFGRRFRYHEEHGRDRDHEWSFCLLDILMERKNRRKMSDAMTPLALRVCGRGRPCEKRNNND